MLLLLEECMKTGNAIEISHYMVIYAAAIWRGPARCGFLLFTLVFPIKLIIMFKHQASYLLICSICRAVYLCSFILNFFFDICLQLAGLVVEYHLGRCCLGLGETGVGCSRLEVSYGHSLMIYKVLEGPTLACTSSRMSSHHHSYLLLSFFFMTFWACVFCQMQCY